MAKQNSMQRILKRKSSAKLKAILNGDNTRVVTRVNGKPTMMIIGSFEKTIIKAIMEARTN
jgi:hypothetical protein